MEALHGLKKKHFDAIEECDKMFLRNVFDCPRGTPLEAFFLETSTLPLRFILQGQSMMYLFHKSEKELAGEVYDLQQIFQTKDSSAEMVENDLETCEINLSHEEIKNFNEYKMSKLVKSKIREQSDKYLLVLREKHVKTEKLSPLPAINSYLISEELSTKEKQLLFKLRVSMLPLKANFSNAHRNLQCDLCNEYNTTESQVHLLQCRVLVTNPQFLSVITTIKYDDIFKDLSTQIKAVKVWSKIWSVSFF